ncbi:hypothetical protein WR25_09982 [Diploscapter pachys]|uniref:Uncharacterized protein n=1 Tax=Diploscapter pachys TaxID=2018661 RepID=A0A2A2KFF1_9BILA|nr:hypothetical protein WR25_09982 [Diploscapter pachys]
MKSRSLSVCLDLDLFLILSLICIQLTTPIVITSDSEEDRPRAVLSTFTVDVLLTIEHISGIDFFSQTIDVICTVEIWQSGLNSSVLEHRLQNDNKPINSPFNDILFESEDETQLGVQHLTLLHGKVVASRTRYKLTVPCDYNQNVPFDSHKCYITLISRSEAIEDLALRWASDPIRGQSELSIPAFDIIKLVPIASVHQIAMPSAANSQSLLRTYSSLTARLHLRRALFLPILRFFIPSSLLLFFSWLSFYLPRTEITARVLLMSASFVSQLIICISFIYSLPSPTGFSAADIWCCLVALQCILVVILFACTLISETTAKKYRNLQCEDRDVREQSVVKYQQQATKNARYRESSHTSEAKFAPTTVVGVEFRKRADTSSLCSARIDILSRTICPLVYIIFTTSVLLLSDSAPPFSPSPLSSSPSLIPLFHWSHISTSPGSILLLLLNASTTCICIECDLDPFFSLSQLGEGAHEQFTANQPGYRAAHWRQPNLKQSRPPIQVSSLECMTCLTTPSTTQLDNFRITTRLNRPVCPMESIKCDRDQTACVTITMHIGGGDYWIGSGCEKRENFQHLACQNVRTVARNVQMGFVQERRAMQRVCVCTRDLCNFSSTSVLCPFGIVLISLAASIFSTLR